MMKSLVVLVLACAPSLFAQQAVLPRVTPDALRDHYAAVLAELAGADTSQLDAARLARRHALLLELEAYRHRADFGRNPGEDRSLLFRDADGRLCAVANLMRATGHEALVDRIAALRNSAFVIELTDVPGVAEWLEHFGLSAAEAARIQAPGMGNVVSDSDGAAAGSDTGGSWSTPGGTIIPGDSNTSGAGGTAPTGRARGAPSGTGASTTAGSGAGGRIGSRGSRESDRNSITGDSAIEPWWVWWELNKSAYLPPQRLSVDAENRSRYAGSAGGPHDRMIAELQPRLMACLADRDATVRAAAALTHGRLSRDAAVDDLLPLLADPSASVRNAALLALGATGSMRAVHELLSIAEDGLVGGRKVSGDSRPLALLSLGIARRRGVAESVDTFLANWATAAGDNSLRAQNVREAALIALDLARSPAATEDADTHLAGKGDGAALTSRLLETMGRAGDPSHVPALLNQAGSVDLERRRAAAIALSGFDSPLLAGALMTAFEVETEPLARGFLLLSLAEQSGDAARDFLVAALHDGPAECRPWAALALGAHARREGDESSRAVLREGLRDAGEAQGARVLACGLARDPLALSPLGDLLAESANPRVRMFAALSMAMIGGDAASAVLRERLGVETSPLARVGLAQALGVLGHGEDVEALLHEVRSVSSPTLAAQLATAIGFHGSERAAAGLVEVLADRDTSAATRAAALDGLALLLDRNEPLLLAQAGAQRNFMALSDWLREVLPTSTL